ncbi:MAG: sugar phosphate isomerase/epimerase [Armatimonadetes bacterium]|nr:sugar phosphate isomerase/epimerase [Armatimonadota bacterium]
MKVAVNVRSFALNFYRGEMDLEKFIWKAKELGADAVELSSFYWRDRNAEIGKVKVALKEAKMPVCTWAVWNNFVNPERGKREEALNSIYNGIEEAVNLNCGVVRVLLGTVADGVLFQTALDWIVTGLVEAVKYAAVHGVVLAIENHGFLVGKSEQIEGVIKTVSSPILRANVDTGNFLLVNQYPADAIRRLAPWIVSVHLKDYKEVPIGYQGNACIAADGRKYMGTVLGEGDADIQECLKVLRETGYKGYLSIEYEGDEDPFGAVSKSISYVRSLIAAPS